MSAQEGFANPVGTAAAWKSVSTCGGNWTVEHIIGESGGGYPGELRATVAQPFPTFIYAEQMQVVEEINTANTGTACSVCNSMTSRDGLPGMEDLPK